MSKIIIYYISFTLILNTCYAQNKEKMQKQNIDLSETLTVKKYEAIVEFMLKNGDRQTYCNMYNNNPHYKLDGFDIFLNPINQGINWSKDKLSYKISDYDMLVIQDFSANVKYYRVTLSNNKVLLDIDSEKDFDFIKKEFLLNYLPKMEKEFKIN
jgi:hypothetical protein